MHKINYSTLLVSFTLICCGCSSVSNGSSIKITEQEFKSTLQDLATAWNEGDAKTAVSIFSQDAIYSEPPAKQIYKGQTALFDFFGGENGRPGLMTMKWHHLAFRNETQIGFGEFSFTYGTTAHGVAVVKIKDGKISNWREYWYESELEWDEFTKENNF